MAKWQVNNPIRYDVPPQQGGDTVYNGFFKTANELNNIYNYLNDLRSLRSGDTPPTDAEMNELWLDTSTNPPILKRWDGTRWADVNDFGFVNVKSFGAKGDGVNDDTQAIQNAINYVATTGGVVFFPKGVYITTAPLLVPSSVWLKGVSQTSSIIKKITNTTGNGRRSAPDRQGIYDDYNVDSIISIDHADNKYAYYVGIEALRLQGGAPSSNQYGIYAPRVSHLEINNVTIDNLGGKKPDSRGIIFYDAWLVSIRNVTITYYSSGIKFANDGSNIGTGTSVNLTRVWVADANIAYDFYGLSYSSFTSCAADHITESSYKFVVCHQITLNGCGTEDTTNVLTAIGGTGIIVNGLRCYKLNGVSGGTSAAVWIEDCSVIFNSSNIPNFDNPYDSYNVYCNPGNKSVIFNNTIFPTNGKVHDRFLYVSALNLPIIKGQTYNACSVNDAVLFALKDHLFDMLAFSQPISARYLYNGSWVSITPPKDIFVPEIPGSFIIQNMWSEVELVFSNPYYAYGDILFVWATTKNNLLQIIVDTSVDGVNWQNVFTSVPSNIGWPGIWRNVGRIDLRNKQYLRIRLIPEWKNSENIEITKIALVGLLPRTYNQIYTRNKMPLYWDHDKNIFITGKVGIKTGAPHSTIHSIGSFATALTTVSANTTLDDTHHTVLVNASSSSVTITLPSAVGITGRQYIIKATSIGSGYSVTVAPQSGQTIDGDSSYSITNTNAGIVVVSDGTGWKIIGKF